LKPFLSVVMPTYNGQQFIAAALESVRDQQHREGLELVIVDDGSTDRTLDIVREFASVLPIRLITPGRLGNWVAASNIGLREAGGEWACFLHQDDLWLPGRLARLRREMESAEAHSSFTMRSTWVRRGKGSDPGPAHFPKAPLHPIYLSSGCWCRTSLPSLRLFSGERGDSLRWIG
jgi:glycosyltransferase involved in cell wall biosynthesis